MTHVYYGDGKGKTSAALGLAVRAAGSGLGVCLVQFLKSRGSGEIAALSKIDNIEIADMPIKLPFFYLMSEKEKQGYRDYANKTFLWATMKKCNVLILDELLDIVSLGIIDESKVISFIKEKPDGQELIITGHEASQAIIDIADYVSFISAQKHPYQKGITGRKGIEY